MARQAGPLFFTGTIDDLTFYKMEGEYYAHKKSSLDRQQFRTDPRFKRSRVSAAKFGEASKLASEIYHLLPKEAKGKGVIGKLTGHVGCLLREGKTAEEIIKHFQQQFRPANTKSSKPFDKKDISKTTAYTSSWKVTPSGKLIAPKPLHLLTIPDRSAYQTAVMQNSYQVPQQE